MSLPSLAGPKVTPRPLEHFVGRLVGMVQLLPEYLPELAGS